MAEHEPRFPSARWVATDGLHVTLHFLGGVEPARLEAVAAGCARAATVVAAADLTIGGLGAFPSPRRARVLWAGIDDPAGLCAATARGLRTELGADSEDRPFVPHLTLARFRAPAPLGELPGLAPAAASFPVTELVLFRSHLGRPAARYEALERFPLGPQAAGTDRKKV